MHGLISAAPFLAQRRASSHFASKAGEAYSTSGSPAALRRIFHPPVARRTRWYLKSLREHCTCRITGHRRSAALPMAEKWARKDFAVSGEAQNRAVSAEAHNLGISAEALIGPFSGWRKSCSEKS